MITTILYDLDETLINSPRFNFGVTFEKEYGVTEEMLRSFFKGVFQECLTREGGYKRGDTAISFCVGVEGYS